jgi:hypothetical protein
MSYTTIYFLAKADNFDEAENHVSAYLETESFFDYFNVLPESSGPLKEKHGEISELVKTWNWRERADSFLAEAEKYREDKSSLFGTCLIHAGVLYAQCLTIDTCIYNTDTGDYTVPTEDEGWQVTAVYFHY